MKNLKKYLLYYFSKQFIYFLFAGSTAAFVNFTSRLLLRSYMDIVFSAVIAYSLGLLTAFVLYKKLVFPFSEKPLNFQLRRFLSIQIGFMPIVIIIFMTLSDILDTIGFGNLSEPLAHAISIGMPALITFLLYKLFVFIK
jgi:putative flippase GtrA